MVTVPTATRGSEARPGAPRPPTRTPAPAFRLLLDALEKPASAKRPCVTPGTPRPAPRAAPEPERERARPPSRRVAEGRADEACAAERTDLTPFRPLPTILGPGATPTRPTSGVLEPSWGELVTRLRVGRTREGALVQIRLEVPGRGRLDVEIVEAVDGVEIRAEDASPRIREALVRELARRGLSARLL